MPNDPRKHRCRSIRLEGYDYARPGAYFVTICAQGGEPLFGQVEAGRMRLNAAGEMVWCWWQKLSEKYPSVRTDAAVVMPNHFHGIIVISGDPGSGQPRGAAPTGTDAIVGATPGGRPNADMDDRPPTLGQIVGWLKTMTTNEYIRGMKQLGWPPFPGKVWQRNYYEHIIRDRDALDRIRVYIQTNPQRWALDRENPERDGFDEWESWLYGPSDGKEGGLGYC